MPTLVQIDESSGTQNGLIAGVTTNDIDILSGGIAFPTEFSTALAAVTGGQGIPSVAALSGFGTATTDDDFIPVTFGANVSDVAFTLTGGNGVDSTLMTTNGTKIFLYVYSGNNNVVLGRLGTAGGLANPDGAIAFAAYLDTQTPEVNSDVGATAARLWLIQYLALQHPDGTTANDVVTLSGLLNVQVNNVLNFSLEGAPSGNNLFLMFGDGTPSLTDTTIVVTGEHPANQSGADPISTADDISITTGETVNTGQGGGGTTLGNTSQMVNPQKGLIFTYVTGADPNFTVSKTEPKLDQNEADIEANIAFTALVPSTGATFAVVQLQQDSLAELQISAFNTDLETGTSYVDGLGDARRCAGDHQLHQGQHFHQARTESGGWTHARVHRLGFGYRSGRHGRDGHVQCRWNGETGRPGSQRQDRIPHRRHAHAGADQEHGRPRRQRIARRMPPSTSAASS